MTLNLGLTSGASVVRETDNANGNTNDAVKIYIDGTLRWLKVDQDGAPLGGATFEVCRTHDLDSSTNPDSLVALNPTVCSSVADNGAGDDDADAGELQMSKLILGTWTIRETAAPAGYQGDPSTKTVQLTLEAPSNVDDAPTFVTCACSS